jgi:phospholipid/cholesterol/gamma-HCH transport system ATP-binding protein
MNAPIAKSSGSAKPTGQTVVRLVNLHKRFGNLIVLDGINLELLEGQTTVIIGESGSGKSVLLNHIVRLMKPDSGEVYFRGRRIDTLPERELARIRPRFGYLFQLSALFDSMTVGQNVAFPLREHTQKSREEIDRIVKQKLSMVGLDGIQNKSPAELSGGQKKRVALARAIAFDPEMILYDEPTTGLDPPRADEINELIIKLKRELSVTSVVVTHDMASARKIADRIVMLFRGKFIFDGTPDSIENVQDPRVRNFVQGQCGQEVLRTFQSKEKV